MSVRISDMTRTASTTALAAGAMVPVVIDGENYRYDLGTKLRATLSPEERGAVGDATGVAGVGTNDQAAMQAALDELGDDGGGTLVLTRGAVYRIALTTSVTNSGLVIPDDVTLDLNGATLSLECTGGAVYGCRLSNRSVIRGPGMIQTVVSTSPGAQGIWHSCISAGDGLGHGGTVASPSAFHFVEGWRVENVTVIRDTSEPGVAIAFYGGANNGVVDGVTAPSSANLYGVVHMDWSYVGADGSITSADVDGSRDNFDINLAYTTHPHDIVVRNIFVGNMTRTGDYAAIPIRMSGVHSITIENVVIEGSVGAGLYHTAGDFGYELAPDVGHVSGKVFKPFRHKRIVIRNFTVRDANNGFGLFADCFADNVAAQSATYPTPLLDPVQRADMLIENFTTHSDGGASTIAGFRFENIIGVTLRNCRATGHKQGVFVEDGGDEILITGGTFYSNREDGIFIDDSTGLDRPQFVTIEGVRAYQNETAGGGGSGNIRSGRADNVTIRDCLIGFATETATWGIRVTSDTTGLVLEDNRVLAIKNLGVGYSIGASGEYSIVRKFRNNTHASVASPYGAVAAELALNTVELAGSATYDPGNLADGAGVTTTVTVTGAAAGDFARASFSNDLQGITLTAWVSAADTVSVRFQNESGGVLDLASGTLRARVDKA